MTNDTAARVPCGHCRGTGKIRLATEISAVLAAVDDTWRTTTEIRERLPMARRPSMPLLNNRLKRLLELGYVERQEAGRQLQWRRL